MVGLVEADEDLRGHHSVITATVRNAGLAPSFYGCVFAVTVGVAGRRSTSSSPRFDLQTAADLAAVPQARSSLYGRNFPVYLSTTNRH